MWTVTLTKHRATWHFFTGNPQGGGFGSSHCGTQGVALAMAIQNIPAGTPYRLTVNGKERGLQTR